MPLPPDQAARDRLLSSNNGSRAPRAREPFRVCPLARGGSRRIPERDSRRGVTEAMLPFAATSPRSVDRQPGPREPPGPAAARSSHHLPTSRPQAEPGLPPMQQLATISPAPPPAVSNRLPTNPAPATYGPQPVPRPLHSPLAAHLTSRAAKTRSRDKRLQLAFRKLPGGSGHRRAGRPAKTRARSPRAGRARRSR